ncbi:Acyl-coenzyme A thioesterase 13 [Kappamyces sp. JEL0829]|nr:Acyl-coenzyme A thioesterase 13 [Kappamyces sp. JEL0829]
MTSHLRKVQEIGYNFLRHRPLFSKINIKEASPEKVVAEFRVEQEHLNINDNLFGGFTASLVDIGGSLAIASKSASNQLGVSTDLNITFLRAARLGELVRIESSCSKVGRNLAYSKVELFVGDRAIAHGRFETETNQSHTKFMG